ncbi:MAG: hypothetical protein ABIW76_14295 [Fibrobacteria bacterium]
MNIGNIITSASLALAILGGVVAFTPAPVEAARRCNPQLDVCIKAPPHGDKKMKKCPRGRVCLH